MDDRKLTEDISLSCQEQILIEHFRTIEKKEPEMCGAIFDVVKHVAETYSDKYAKGQEHGIDTKKMLYDPKTGGAINVYQISRYLQRYNTEGSQKSQLIKDLHKMVHYALFEIVRRGKMADGDKDFEPKV